jgi:hypothetical protein
MKPEMTICAGTKVWQLNGHYHREDGPAVEYPDGTKSWWLNGKRHRTDGPAIEWDKRFWYLNGTSMTEQQWLSKVLFNEVKIIAL